jgi:hypothetical protein
MVCNQSDWIIWNTNKIIIIIMTVHILLYLSYCHALIVTFFSVVVVLVLDLSFQTISIGSGVVLIADNAQKLSAKVSSHAISQSSCTIAAPWTLLVS